MARQAARRETPARLRLWVTVTVLTAIALLASTSVLMARVQDQVRAIGEDAAPRAATAADLYFALSDMDAQVARLVLTTGNDSLAGSQIDALGTYRERGRQVDADLQRLMGSGGIVLDLMNDLSIYRERVWQALTAGDGAAGYYTQATNVLHLDLLPAAERLRELSEERLDRAYEAKQATGIGAVASAVALGLLLVGLLLALQIWLARRFRRLFNPALIAATVLTVAVVAPAVTVLIVQEQRLTAARNDSLRPFLALSSARAVSYDAAADTSRYLISDNLAFYKQDFDRKSAFLDGASGLPAAAAGRDVSPYQTDQVLTRWRAYRQAHERILTLADQGRDASAIGYLTGIRRGDAAFDFSYYDAAVAEIAAGRADAFDDAMRTTSQLLTGWPWIPVGVLGMVVLLVPLSVRKRFAEYR
ncbi:hypothetical protein Ade02nite_94610 [Paractinoplanes deccanensis]|uniref:Secreted protein n=1 Tax=Paractinoplanes deccanensis TaxID=113561 RepID=A0ABQ3YLZ6_9ACTN|nr:hypothetical protein Ade02nite_94610 [Actinoplanes deccanensis]